MSFTPPHIRKGTRKFRRFTFVLSGLFFILFGGLFLFDEDARAAGPSPNLTLIKQTGGLISPLHITHAADSSGRLFVVEQEGRIRIIREDVLQSTPFLDISDRVLSGGERGLLSVAFPPGFKEKGRFYVDYTRKPDGATVIARYHVGVDEDRADHSSEETIMIISQPFPNHNGGQLAFGRDGFLYIGMGDGGSEGDPLNNAQNKGSLLGKMLRIDVESGGVPYSVPASNPFIHSAAYRPEIWALGLRNPWRFSFDRLTGDLYIGDVGQNRYEEVDFRPASDPGGENYGWNIMEGLHCYSNPSCSSAGLTAPVSEYDHSQGDCSITGGMVYRGKKYPGIQGIYHYGDYCSGTIRGLVKSAGSFQNSTLLASGHPISTFGEDESGNLFLADYASGEIFRVADLVSDIAVPAAVSYVTFPAPVSPVVSSLRMVPLGFGPIASGGGTLQLEIATGQFSAPVDMYAALTASIVPGKIFLLKPDLSFQEISPGLSEITPFLRSVRGPVDKNPLTLPASSIPPGTYTAYFLITPAGRLDSYYLASSSLVIP